MRARSVAAGQPDQGLHIDRMAERSNPIYGMDNPTGTATGLGASTAASNGQWGWHYADPGGAVQAQDATLYDGPSLPGHGPNSSQIFETTALAVEGTQAGTLYGSVRWGWRSDATNRVAIEPLAVVSVGVPTASFRTASRLWNAGTTSAGGATQQLPIATGTSTTKLPRDMTTQEIQDRLKEIEREKLQAAISNPVSRVVGGETQTLQSLDFEQQALRRELWSRMGDFPTPDPNGPRMA